MLKEFTDLKGDVEFQTLINIVFDFTIFRYGCSNLLVTPLTGNWNSKPQKSIKSQTGA